MFFAAFIDQECLNKIVRRISEREYRTFTLESVLPDKSLAISYGVQLAHRIYAKTRFDNAYFMRVSAMCLENVRRFDQQLSKTLSQFEEEELQSMLMKTTINFCLHLTESIRLSQAFVIVQLESSLEEQAFYLQCLLSTCSRIMCPRLFPVLESDAVYCYKYGLFIQ